MSLRATAKRWTYLLHRWLGIGGCVLMLLWFVSGMVMLFIGLPKLTPWERLAALPALVEGSGLRGLSALPAGLRERPEQVALTTVRGEPSYVVRGGANAGAWSARSGAPLGPVSAMDAQAAAAAFAGVPVPAGVRLLAEDRWTHSGRLDVHRPLYRVQVGGARAGSIYVSSRTGEVVLDAPYVQQRWSYVGAWLHWLYFLRTQPSDPVWTWTVTVLSALCTLAAASGIVVGIWRWRFRGRYRSGSHSPYGEPWMRWHHLLGMVVSAFVFTWIFSGLVSMNPEHVFDSEGAAVDEARFRGGTPPLTVQLAEPAALLSALHGQGFYPVELQWRRVGGELLALAMDGQGQRRVVREQKGALQVAPTLPEAWLRHAAGRMVDAPVRAAAVIGAADAYYYPRAPEAMNGAQLRGLPALAMDFDDADATRVYFDMASGDPVLVMGRGERVRRWLFSFLHSWDLPFMLKAANTRVVLLLLLSVAGAALCATSVVIGWRRLRRTLGQPPQRMPRRRPG